MKDGYLKLFAENTIENITISAFPSLSDVNDQRFSDMYIYTASVCDIILNPNCPTLEVSKKAIELRLKKFNVFIEFIVVILKLILLIKVKIRKPLIKTVKLNLAIQNRSYEKKRLIILAKRNLPMVMMKKSNHLKTRRYRRLKILILKYTKNYLINNGNYFNLLFLN